MSRRIVGQRLEPDQVEHVDGTIARQRLELQPGWGIGMDVAGHFATLRCGGPEWTSHAPWHDRPELLSFRSGLPGGAPMAITKKLIRHTTATKNKRSGAPRTRLSQKQRALLLAQDGVYERPIDRPV